jgi:hypothetical protein
MAINWELGVAPDIIGNALNAFDEGRKMRREETARNALGVILGGGQTTPGQTPGIGDGIPGNKPMGGVDPTAQAWADLGRADPLTALKARELFAGKAKEQRSAQAEQMQQLGRILNHARDEATYQQARQAAQKIGIDISSAPANYDPAWVDQQKLVLSAFEKDGGQQISGLARELQDAGYQPGTPQFADAMRTALQGKYAPTYTDEQGNMRRGQLPALPGAAATPQQPQQAITFEMYRGATNGLGSQGAAAWLQRNGLPVKVATPQEAHQLPRGTKIILPDGSEGVVP